MLIKEIQKLLEKNENIDCREKSETCIVVSLWWTMFYWHKVWSKITFTKWLSEDQDWDQLVEVLSKNENMSCDYNPNGFISIEVK